MTHRIASMQQHQYAKVATTLAERAIGRSANMSMAQQHARRHDTLELLFQQLAQSLKVLSSTAELLVDGRPRDAQQDWLRPHARQAEEAMHKLRGMQLAITPALTDLSQCLTVLVLAADMLAQGHLSKADAFTFYSVLRRNVDGAMKSMAELCSQLMVEA